MPSNVNMVGKNEAARVALEMVDKLFDRVEAEGANPRDAATASSSEVAAVRAGLKQQADKALLDAVVDRIKAYADEGNQLSRDDVKPIVKASIYASTAAAARGDNFISSEDRLATSSNLAECAYLAARVKDQRKNAAVEGWETRRAQQGSQGPEQVAEPWLKADPIQQA